MKFEILIEYIKKGQLQSFSNALDQYLQEEGHELNDQDIFGYSLLAWATLQNRPKTMALLLKKEAAIAADRTEVVIPLVDQGDTDNKTPLMYAAENGVINYVQLFLENNASLDIEDDQGKTALIHALEAGNLKIAELLINRGASLKGVLKTLGNKAIDWVEFYDLLIQTEVMLPVRRNIHNLNMKDRAQESGKQLILVAHLDQDTSKIVGDYLYKDSALRDIFNKAYKRMPSYPSLQMSTLSLGCNEVHNKRTLEAYSKPARKNQKCLKRG